MQFFHPQREKSVFDKYNFIYHKLLRFILWIKEKLMKTKVSNFKYIDMLCGIHVYLLKNPH